MGTGVARRIAKGKELLQIGVQSGRGAQFAVDGVIEQLTDPYQASRKCPFAAQRPGLELDQVGFQPPLIDHENYRVDCYFGAPFETMSPLNRRRLLKGSFTVGGLRRLLLHDNFP